LAIGIGPLTFRHNGGMTEGRHSCRLWDAHPTEIALVNGGFGAIICLLTEVGDHDGHWWAAQVRAATASAGYLQKLASAAV
jgi:hypothetical protein